MTKNWTFNGRDQKIADSLQEFIPSRIFDIHAHLYRREDLPQGQNSLLDYGPNIACQEVWRQSLLRQFSGVEPSGGLFFPFPMRNMDVLAANDFLCNCLLEMPDSRGLLVVTPSMNPDLITEKLKNQKIAGFKPYHCFAAEPSFQASIDDFAPEWIWKLASERKLILMLHLVRDRALTDPENLCVLQERCSEYSEVRVILAHAARGFHPPHTIKSVSHLRGLENIWFDTSAICETGALVAILDEFGPKRLLWGSDFPICEQRGRCVSLGDSFVWVGPQSGSDCNHIGTDSSTLVGLEALLALREATDIVGLNRDDISEIFFRNAQHLLGLDCEPKDQTQSLYEKAKRRIPGGVQLLSKRPEMMAPGVWPAYFREARGCETWDLAGRHYYDMSTNGIGACLLGFRDPDVTREVQRRIRFGSMCSLNPPEEVELADRLCAIHRWAEQVRFARTGGEAAAIAVRIARATTGRNLVAVCGYHGWHDWYLAANLGDENALSGHLLPGLDPAGVPDGLRGTAYTFTYNRLDEIQDIFKRHGDHLAAVIMEPCRYKNPDPGFLEWIREESRRYGCLLIFDEITIGWRLCYGGAHLRLGIEPDLAVFAKALGNGHPMAAIVGTQDAMYGAHKSFISSTYWTESVGPVAALTTLNKMQKVDIPLHIQEIGECVRQVWQECAENHQLPVIVEDGHACLAHFRFTGLHKNVLRTLYAQEMLKRGFLAGCAVYPTLAHTSDVVYRFADAVHGVFSVLAEALNSGNPTHNLRGSVAHEGFRRLL